MNAGNKPAIFQRILFCTDFSENADLAFGVAVEQARRAENPDFHLLHVIPEPGAQFWKAYVEDTDLAGQKAQADLHFKIKETYQARLPKDLSMTVTLRNGVADEAILFFAAEIKADLLVIGRHGRSALAKVWFGNVTEKVVRKARCAVLVVPARF